MVKWDFIVRITMNSRQLFPLSIAIGESFYGRKEEQEQLAHNILQAQHTLLIAPRRYGKTSLTLQVLHLLNIPWVSLDFLMVQDAESVQNHILEAVSKLIAEIVPAHKKAFDKVLKFFTSLSPELTITDHGFQLLLKPGAQPHKSIVDALEGLDHVAREHHKSVAIFMDEFQQVSQIKHCEVIEAAIRHAAERMQNVCFIFAGSNRHLLAAMFDSRTRPLFRLCDRMILNRLKKEDYYLFLQKAAQKKWQKPLSDKSIETLLGLTECHPYHVNVLGSRLWRLPNVPSSEQIKKIWEQYIDEERNRIAHEIGSLSQNQRTVLLALVISPTKKPTSKEFLSQVDLPSSSVAQALQSLIERDWIYRESDGTLRLLDPVMSYFLSRIKHETSNH
jgi:hypothetical protein